MSGAIHDLISGLVRSYAIYGAAIVAQRLRGACKRLALYLWAMLLFLAGLGFITFAVYRALSSGLGEVYAALIVGGFYMVIGLTLLLAVEMRRSN
jgi:hypothetical protein